MDDVKPSRRELRAKGFECPNAGAVPALAHGPPAGRWGSPENVARLVSWLASTARLWIRSEPSTRRTAETAIMTAVCRPRGPKHEQDPRGQGRGDGPASAHVAVELIIGGNLFVSSSFTSINGAP